MPNQLISIENITKSYQSAGTSVSALQGFSLQIPEGQAVAVMGQSGSGKSTLLSVIGGLNPPSGGKVLIDDIDLYALPREKRADFRREYIGFVFQQFQLIPYLTALENVLLPLTTTRFPAKEKREMAGQALKRVGMDMKQNRLPNQLSGGEQERVAIARAIVNEPPLILADEPTGSLDTKTAREIMELFGNLNKAGLTVLMVTHNPENSAYMNRTITMQDGLLIDDSEAADMTFRDRDTFCKGAAQIR
jgi:putative ABC transport system ATP-binding protein